MTITLRKYLRNLTQTKTSSKRYCQTFKLAPFDASLTPHLVNLQMAISMLAVNPGPAAAKLSGHFLEGHESIRETLIESAVHDLFNNYFK